MRALTGADPISAGQVLLNGREITPKRPRDAIRNGMVLVPEDRKLQGLILQHSIAENIAYANMDAIAQAGWVGKRRVHDFADKQIEQFGVKGIGRQNANEMSGGNQQKLVIAKWLAQENPQVVVLDEPTRGIDVGARSSIYDIIVELAAPGCRSDRRQLRPRGGARRLEPHPGDVGRPPDRHSRQGRGQRRVRHGTGDAGPSAGL